MSRTTVTAWMRQLFAHAGAAGTSHQIRHAVATIGFERTRDVRAVQELLGHQSLATTQRYTAVTGARVRDVVDLLGPLFASVG